MAQSVKPVAAADVSAPPEKIDPSFVKLNAENWCWREVCIHVGPNVTVAALNDDPTLFSKVQKDQRAALRVMDRVVIVAHDASWLADGWVTGADDKSVSLGIGKIIPMQQRTATLFSSGGLAVIFLGGNYAVQRQRDGHIMADGFANADIAAKWLCDSFPRKVS